MKKIIITTLVFLGIFSIIFYTSGESSNIIIEASNSEIKITENNINIGEIPMDEGKINIPFEFTNIGNQDIILSEAETSCLCTEGFVTNSDGGNISDTIIMRGHGKTVNLNRIIKPGEKGFLIAVFDPNAHGPDAVGPISRNVFIKTNSNITSELNFNFLGNVVKTSTNKENTKKNEITNLDTFSFDEDSFDFGKIKQSGGIVKHDFRFTYNGEEEINITGIPASCACTTAEINKTNFKKGESGILTVIFNPNLHDEPEGRFFKTVSILTDIKLEKIPEVKIWAEIDLDLGTEAFELQTKHIE